MKNFYRKENRGFTLVETLVAVSIFTASILGLLSLLTQSISNTSYAKEKIISSYLSAEGIEYIRNMRDTFALYDPVSGQNGWNAFVSKLVGASCQANNGCYFNDQSIDYANPLEPMEGLTVTACGASCPTLLYDPTTGKYGYASGAASPFIRKINITQVSADELKVSSTIFWSQGSGNYNVTVSESLFNWIE